MKCRLQINCIVDGDDITIDVTTQKGRGRKVTDIYTDIEQAPLDRRLLLRRVIKECTDMNTIKCPAVI